MKVSSVRLGHATNSSSTHSILINCQDRMEVLPKEGELMFGWDNFILHSTEQNTFH